MIPKKIEPVIIACIIINVSLVLIFAAVFEKQPDPIGVLMVTSAGTVKFNHYQHTVHGTQELKCDSCHHRIKDENENEFEPPTHKCRQCHYSNTIESSPCNEVETHKRCVGEKCNGCHLKMKCEFCHHR